MKILSLRINGYKMFNPSPKIVLGKDINLLIGVNGSGKSTVLEAIAHIFAEFSRYCEKGEPRRQNFSFSVEYSFTLSEAFSETMTKRKFATSINHVVLSSSNNKNEYYSMYVDGKPIKLRKEMMKFLPDNLIFYYAGFSPTLDTIIAEIYKDWAEQLYSTRNQEKLSNVIEGMNKSLIYIRPEYFPLLFLLNYINNDNNKIALSGKSFNINEIKLHITKPDFTSSNDFRNFYNLRGFLGSFLNNLLQDSHEFEPTDKLSKKSSDAILTIGYHRSLISAIKSMLDINSQEAHQYLKYYLFHVFCLLFHIGLLKKIIVTIRDSEGQKFDINQLSEGEQQIITIDAINNFLCKENSVLIFDEPDAFLHPQRQREILPFLKEKFDKRFNNDYVQLIVSSHSLFSTQSICIQDIILFKKNGKIRTFKEKLLSYVTISNELFGIESEFGKEIENELRKFKILTKNVLLNKKLIDNELLELKKQLDSYGEALEVITNFEIRKLLKQGIHYEEDGKG